VQLADDAGELPDLDVVVLNQIGGKFEPFGVGLSFQVKDPLPLATGCPFLGLPTQPPDIGTVRLCVCTNP
jgi:hypothetical protein